MTMLTNPQTANLKLIGLNRHKGQHQNSKKSGFDTAPLLCF